MSMELTMCPNRKGVEDKVYRFGECCATCKHCTKIGSLCAASENPAQDCLCVEEQNRQHEPMLHKLWQAADPKGA
ncbi:MAG: hypothetical protein WCK05_14915 [Planctomycetota bacterium]